MLRPSSVRCAPWVFAYCALGILAGCQCDSKAAQPVITQTAPPIAAPTTEPAAPWSDAWLIARGERYLSDLTFRRESMARSLRNHENLYSRQRIAAYGFGTRGWDALPEWNPISHTVRLAENSDEAAADANSTRLWDGKKPETADAWRALGKEVFHRYPLRSDAFVDYGVKARERGAHFGLQRDATGALPGVVAFKDVDGKYKTGITCALCHTSVVDGEAIDGLARRDFDYGGLRLEMHQKTGTPVDPELARRMATWGPGRADITEDEAEDPVSIPDLWGLQHYESLTQAGTIRHIGPEALALRQESQLLHANHQRTRPPRVLAWALAMYMYSLEPPRSDAPSQISESMIGKTLFKTHCMDCHSNPAGGGQVVDAVKLGVHQALAFGIARGTGKYRPPNLTRVRGAAPYFHDGSLPDLQALFDPARLSAEYQDSPRGPGAVPGHRFGLDWSDAEKASMVAYLQTL